MDAPTCRLCGTKHWPKDGHKFSGGSSAEERKASNLGVEGSTPSRRSTPPQSTAGRKRQKTALVALEATRGGPARENGATVAGSSSGRTAEFDSANLGSNPSPASKFDKRAYQREYMRGWRKRQKAKGE